MCVRAVLHGCTRLMSPHLGKKIHGKVIAHPQSCAPTAFLQDVCKQYMPTATKRQTMPHMSIGSVILDKESPAEYNAASKHRSGLLANTKTLLDKLDPPLSARIQHLKLNSDGCLTLQLESDPSQDIVLTEKQLEKALAKVPTCNTPEALANEKRKFQRAEDGGCIVSRLQQVSVQAFALQ